MSNFTWSQNANLLFLLYKGRLLVRFSEVGIGYIVENGPFPPNLSMARQAALRLARQLLADIRANIAKTEAMLQTINVYGDRAALDAHGQAIRVEPVPFISDKWKVTLADGYQIETQIPIVREK